MNTYEFSPDAGKHWYPLSPVSIRGLVSRLYHRPEVVMMQLDRGESLWISARAQIRHATAAKAARDAMEVMAANFEAASMPPAPAYLRHREAA